MNKRYYVYVLLDTRKEGIWYYNDKIMFNQPFYVGEGCKNRINSHFTTKNLTKDTLKNRIIKKIQKENIEVIRVVLYKDLSKEEALKIEGNFIKIFGRICNKSGILSNILDYGNLKNYSTEFKKGKTNEELYGKEKAISINQNNSKMLKEKYNNGEITPYWKDKKFSENTKIKISNSLKNNKRRLGKKHSESDKINISIGISKSKGKPLKTIDLNNNILYFYSITKAAEFYKISPQMLDEAFKNKNYCNSKKANCKFELISKEEYDLNTNTFKFLS